MNIREWLFGYTLLLCSLFFGCQPLWAYEPVLDYALDLQNRETVTVEPDDELLNYIESLSPKRKYPVTTDLAYVYFQLGQVDKALELFAKIPNNENAFEIFFRKGIPNPSVTLHVMKQFVINTMPNTYKVKYVLMISDEFREINDPGSAKILLKNACSLAIAERNPDLLVEPGAGVAPFLIKANLNKWAEEVLQETETFIDKMEDRAELLLYKFQAAKCYSHLEKKEKAFTIFEEMKHLYRTSEEKTDFENLGEIYFESGTIYFHLGRFKKAEEMFSIAFEIPMLLKTKKERGQWYFKNFLRSGNTPYLRFLALKKPFARMVKESAFLKETDADNVEYYFEWNRLVIDFMMETGDFIQAFNMVRKLDDLGHYKEYADDYHFYSFTDHYHIWFVKQFIGLEPSRSISVLRNHLEKVNSVPKKIEILLSWASRLTNSGGQNRKAILELLNRVSSLLRGMENHAGDDNRAALLDQLEAKATVVLIDKGFFPEAQGFLGRIKDRDLKQALIFELFQGQLLESGIDISGELIANNSLGEDIKAMMTSRLAAMQLVNGKKREAMGMFKRAIVLSLTEPGTVLTLIIDDYIAAIKHKRVDATHLLERTY